MSGGLATGGGQQIGRSCVVVRVGQYRVMFDCGVHLSYSDSRRFPNLGLLSHLTDKRDPQAQPVDAVVITHL